MARTGSEALFKKAERIIPGGVSSPVRAFRSVGGTPVYFKRAAGSWFEDEDGNRYTDFCMSWGPLILGHSHPAVVEAIREAAGNGLSYGACCAREVELAGLVLQAFPGMEKVRFMSSGTEAVMTAVRLARGATGRSKVVKFEGGYHGHSDSMLVKAGSGLATLGTSSSLGVPGAVAAESIVLPFDDDDALREAFGKFGGSIAAAVVEPLPANNGLLVQRAEWLKLLRDLTTRHGSLLIFDEVISGFRFGFGGYGATVGIRADLVTLGKILGGGMPMAAVAGQGGVMDNLAPLGGVYQAGTLSGNPISLSAGIATLKILRDGDVYTRLEKLGATLDAELEKLGERRGFANWVRAGSIVWPHLALGTPPRRADAISPEAVKRYNGMYHGLLSRGIYLPPSAYEVFFLSSAHSEGDIEKLASAIGAELAKG
jgi:glutamate-1-semialdehyde 2,1-aminomutase